MKFPNVNTDLLQKLPSGLEKWWILSCLILLPATILAETPGNTSQPELEKMAEAAGNLPALEKPPLSIQMPTIETPQPLETGEKVDSKEDFPNSPNETQKALNRSLVPVKNSDFYQPLQLPEKNQTSPVPTLAQSPQRGPTENRENQTTDIQAPQPHSPAETLMEPGNIAQKPPSVETVTLGRDMSLENRSPPPPTGNTSETGEKKTQTENMISTLQAPFNVQGTEAAIILDQTRFRPSVLQVKPDQEIRLLFTTINRKPAALIMEKLNIQTWMLGPDPANPAREPQSSLEINREISSAAITEITFKTEPGTYLFHDALTGARGQIIVK